MSLEAWENLLARAKSQGLEFYSEPKVRFLGQKTEHRSFFLVDPFANLLEFKYYSYEEAIFGSQDIQAIGDR